MRLNSLRRALPAFTRRSRVAIEWPGPSERRVWHFPEQRRSSFRQLGYNQRWPYFPHEVRFLPKAGPDALRLAGWMLGQHDPNALWQLVLHADAEATAGLPAEIFFNDDLVWHQQHLGQPGHIAYACLAERGQDLYGLNYVADVVQRISRQRNAKTKVETRFRGWPGLLLNSMIAFARWRGKRRILSPTADLVLQHVDPERSVQRVLFDRVYDHSVERQFRARRAGGWWIIDVAENSDRVVLPDFRTSPCDLAARTICICHDVERDWGHRESHPDFVDTAERVGRTALPAMLQIEKQLTVRATYHVVGAFLEEVRQSILEGGHALAFHSFDHDLHAAQLERCRTVDYRLRGYRAPQSRRTRELSDRNLCRDNFEWFAAAAATLGVTVPRLENRVVHVPIAFDDYPLFTRESSYDAWEARALKHIERQQFTAFCLHDCYADWWLPHYAEFVGKLRRLGRLVTLDDVSRDLLLAAAA